MVLPALFGMGEDVSYEKMRKRDPLEKEKQEEEKKRLEQDKAKKEKAKSIKMFATALAGFTAYGSQDELRFETSRPGITLVVKRNGEGTFKAKLVNPRGQAEAELSSLKKPEELVSFLQEHNIGSPKLMTSKGQEAKPEIAEQKEEKVKSLGLQPKPQTSHRWLER